MQFTDVTILYAGSGGYVNVEAIEFSGQPGALFFYANPDPRKLHAVDTRGMQELEDAIGAIEARVHELKFVVFYGAYDPVHAGADITEFAGTPDYAAIRTHLLRGAALDARIKALWPKLRTVGIFCGDRYGGSLEWPLFAQWGIADERCTVQFSEVHLGIIPGWNGVLNVLLKSEATNALYMGQTGNTVRAAEMQGIGLVQRLVDTPAPPDRKTIEPGDWAEAWKVHAGKCQPLLLEAALDLATQADAPQREQESVLCGLMDLLAEVKRRTDPAPYRELRLSLVDATDMIANGVAQGALDEAAAAEQLKQLGRDATRKLAEMGKPLAPLAVKAVADFVAKWNPLTAEQILERYGEAGEHESELCASLMDTPHRVVGVNAVLSKNVADKVPVFD